MLITPRILKMKSEIFSNANLNKIGEIQWQLKELLESIIRAV